MSTVSRIAEKTLVHPYVEFHMPIANDVCKEFLMTEENAYETLGTKTRIPNCVYSVISVMLKLGEGWKESQSVYRSFHWVQNYI